MHRPGRNHSMKLQVKESKGGGSPCCCSSSSLHGHGVRGKRAITWVLITTQPILWENEQISRDNILCPGRCAQVHYWGKAPPTPGPTHHSAGQTMNPKSQATHLWFAALTQPQCVTVIIILPYMYCPPPHDVSEHVNMSLATSAHRWGGHYPTYFSSNIVSISNFNYSRYKLHIYRYVVGIRHSCIFCLQGACSKPNLKKSTVEPPCFRSLFEKNIRYL